MDLDFMPRLNEYINTLGYPLHSRIGTLLPSDSIAIFNTPGGSQTEYMDGSRQKEYQVQVNVKSKDVANNLIILNDLSFKLESLKQLQSQNNSFEFGNIVITSLPSIVAEDIQGYVIHALSISVNILIRKEVL